MADYDIPLNEAIGRTDIAKSGAALRHHYKEIDNWSHRGQNMACKTCIWFLPKQKAQGLDLDPVYDIGRCRRHAPTMNGFPVVFVNDWCGDHKIDEEKLIR